MYLRKVRLQDDDKGMAGGSKNVPFSYCFK
jgi:hypothetical protein